MINHYLCLSSFIWQPNQPKNVYLETLVFDDFDFRQTPSWIDYREAVKQRSFLPEVRGLIVKIIEAEWHRDIYTILWRPAIYMYLFLASLAFFVYRTRRKKWLLLSVPLITQSIVIMFTAQLQALRYQYPAYLISMLFTVPLFILGFKTQLIQQKIALQSGEE
jgi:ABC-type proline/glycine betaine transport system permease subunit